MNTVYAMVMVFLMCVALVVVVALVHIYIAHRYNMKMIAACGELNKSTQYTSWFVEHENSMHSSTPTEIKQRRDVLHKKAYDAIAKVAKRELFTDSKYAKDVDDNVDMNLVVIQLTEVRLIDEFLSYVNTQTVPDYKVKSDVK